MIPAPAYAQGPDSSSLALIVVSAALVLVVAGIAFVPLRLAWRGRHRQAEAITTVVLFWALATAGSLIWITNAEFNWNQEYTIRIQSGYADPRDLSGAPQLPWLIWGILAGVYVGLIFWSASRRPPLIRTGFPVIPADSDKPPPTGPAA
jgi:hypothetical protein